MTSEKSVLEVGIVGLGHLHPRSYMALFEGEVRTEVKAVCEADSVLLGEFCSDFGVNGYGSLEEMLEQEDLDVAAIFLPHSDCPAAAEACASKGLHLMIEKPLAASVEGAQRIVKAADDAGVKLTTGYCWRMHPVAGRIKELLNSGVIGRVVSVEGRCAAGRLHRYTEGHSSWILEKKKTGGGPMYNLGVHWIDLFRWMLQDEVVSVSGENLKVNMEYDVEDSSFAHLRFSSGVIGSLYISYTVPDSFPCGRDLYVAVRGTQGVLSWAPAYEGEKDELFICSDSDDMAEEPVRSELFELPDVAGYSGVMGQAYVGDFCDAVFNDAQPQISGEEGVAALKVVEAVYRSAESRSWADVD